jgi:hypothetical protein
VVHVIGRSLLAGGVKSGYSFSWSAGTADSSGNIDSYATAASPVTVGTTGQRYFFTDQSGVIRANPTSVADVNSTQSANLYSKGYPVNSGPDREEAKTSSLLFCEKRHFRWSASPRD